MKIIFYIIILCLISPTNLIAQIIDSTSADYFNEIGVVKAREGKLEEAIISFTNAININPKEVDSRINRGIIYYKIGSRDSACMDWNYASLVCDTAAIDLINKHCDSTFFIANQMPQFPGGEEKLFMFLRDIKYPSEAKINRISGRIYLSIIIKSTGEISDIKVLRGLGFGTEEESIRVLKLMPNWIPGIICNKPVKMRYNIPINFNYK